MTVMLFPRGIILAVNGPLFFLRKPNIENVSTSEDLVKPPSDPITFPMSVIRHLGGSPFLLLVTDSLMI